MKSVVGICNGALGTVGVSMFIQDINERSKEAIVCKQFYETARDQALEEYPWNFATRHAALQDIGSPPAGWLYRYRYPNDCCKARVIVPSDVDVYAYLKRYGWINKIPFTVVEDETAGGMAIVTDLKAPVLAYTARIVNPALFSTKFTVAVEFLLGSKIGGSLASKPEYAKLAGEAYLLAINQAGADTLNEGVERQDATSEFERARL